MRDSASPRYRRSTTVVLVPAEDGRLIARDFAIDVQAAVSPRDVSILASLNGWRTTGEVQQATGLSPVAVRASVRRLHAARLVEASNEPELPRRRAMRQWEDWNPEAGLFHFGTRNRKQVPASVVAQHIDDRLTLGLTPPPRRRRRGAVVALPSARTGGALARTLLERRTWRRFGTAPVRLQDLATLLGLTWGVQRWARLHPSLHVPLKTSPSGGACHSLEVYVAAQNVQGLSRGIYHYDADEHRLVRIRQRLPRTGIERWLRQPMLTPCAAGFFITSVWPRVQWKYGFPRAYRVVLLEAGHFVQSFCLMATALGLAPFCTGAFDDTALERALGIDGIAEGAIYAAGVGARPPDTKWAPWPDESWTPPTYPPAARRKRR